MNSSFLVFNLKCWAPPGGSCRQWIKGIIKHTHTHTFSILVHSSEVGLISELRWLKPDPVSLSFSADLTYSAVCIMHSANTHQSSQGQAILPKHFISAGCDLFTQRPQQPHFENISPASLQPLCTLPSVNLSRLWSILFFQVFYFFAASHT